MRKEKQNTFTVDLKTVERKTREAPSENLKRELPQSPAARSEQSQEWQTEPLKFDVQRSEVENFERYGCNRDCGIEVAAQWWSYRAKKVFFSWKRHPHEPYWELFSREQSPQEHKQSFMIRCRILLAQGIGLQVFTSKPWTFPITLPSQYIGQSPGEIPGHALDAGSVNADITSNINAENG